MIASKYFKLKNKFKTNSAFKLEQAKLSSQEAHKKKFNFFLECHRKYDFRKFACHVPVTATVTVADTLKLFVFVERINFLLIYAKFAWHFFRFA